MSEDKKYSRSTMLRTWVVGLLALILSVISVTPASAHPVRVTGTYVATTLASTSTYLRITHHPQYNGTEVRCVEVGPVGIGWDRVVTVKMWRKASDGRYIQMAPFATNIRVSSRARPACLNVPWKSYAYTGQYVHAEVRVVEDLPGPVDRFTTKNIQLLNGGLPYWPST